jgi:hypothetical protein
MLLNKFFKALVNCDGAGGVFAGGRAYGDAHRRLEFGFRKAGYRVLAQFC